MAIRQAEDFERAARVEQWRWAWFDGWTEGVIWTLAKTVEALRDTGHPEAVGLGVIHSVASACASPDVEAHAELLTPSGSTLRGNRWQPHDVPPRSWATTPRQAHRHLRSEDAGNRKPEPGERPAPFGGAGEAAKSR